MNDQFNCMKNNTENEWGKEKGRKETYHVHKSAQNLYFKKTYLHVEMIYVIFFCYLLN